MKIDDNIETVTCRICGEQCKRIYGKHLKFKHNNMTTNEYKEKFPGAPIMALSDIKNTTKNSGAHMKQEKYKKMFSEKMKGYKNPNHKSNTTELERKSRSPFSKEFIKYKDIDNVEEYISEFAKDAIKDRIHSTTIEYYLDKGYSEEESIGLLRERQRTFTLEKCIEKYGEEKGRNRWLKRQEKWLSSYKKVNYSNISQELFISIYNELLNLGFTNKLYFAKLDENNKIHNTNRNFEYRLKLKDSYILPDFFIPDLKLIIEFDGTYYHRDNTENKERERRRDENIKKSGYNVIHISEKEYIKNKELTIFRIVNYILKTKQLKNV
jgi:very-short-patch-repair endonuclease